MTFTASALREVFAKHATMDITRKIIIASALFAQIPPKAASMVAVNVLGIPQI